MPLSDSLSNSTINHRHVISSPSTNSELIEAIQDGILCADDVHLFTAETQTAGRGQRGRSWQSPPGNVYLSLYHPVQMPISGLLSLIIGVELAKMPVIQALNRQLQAQRLPLIGVKWANDLGFYQKNIQTDKESIIYFNKLAGILIEPVWHLGKLVGVVMGVGLNVKATPTLTTQTCEGMSYQALSLQDMVQIITSRNQNNNAKNIEQNNPHRLILPSLSVIYEQISQALIAAMACFEKISIEQTIARSAAQTDCQTASQKSQPTNQQTSQPTRHLDAFMQQFDTMDALAGLRLRVTQNHQGELQVIHGHACGIDTNGCLQLRQDNGKLAALFTGRIDVIRTA